MRTEADTYLTPIAVVKKVEPFLPASLGCVLDPAAGTGNFQTALEGRAHCWTNFDIRGDAGAPDLTVCDFLKASPNQAGDFTTIITNPPFNLAEEFITAALERWRPERLIYFARLSLLEGVGRYERLWKYHPPKQVVVLPRRPIFEPYSVSDRWAYAWFLWGDVPGSGIAWTTEDA